MEELIKLITDNGISIVCVAYLIYFQLTTMKELNNSMQSMNDSLILMNERLSNIEEKVK